MNEKSLTFTRRASAMAAFGTVIGFISLETPISAIAAVVTFCAAIYFQLRKPDDTGPA